MLFYQLALCRKIGWVFAHAVADEQCDPKDFIYKWLNSAYYDDICDETPCLISQGWHCILGRFLEECPVEKTELPLEEREDIAEAMEWLGYLLMYWCIIEEINGKTIAANYDLMYSLGCYEVMHTTSIKVAIDEIKQFHKLEIKG